MIAAPVQHHRHPSPPALGRPSNRLLALRTSAQAKTEDANRAGTLRELLARPGLLLGPCCHDGLSARLIERAGFDFAFMSGFCTAAARLGAPDTGLLSYGEMVDQGRYVNEATRFLPIIGDGDTGYGNAVNVKRTVRGYAAAGFAGILIEDQQWPKSCGHVRSKRVVGRGEALARIRAACDARDEGRDVLIVARTDARQAESLEEALWRAAAFADLGADVVFVDALESVGEMEALCRIPGASKMANMLEGGGKTPILPPSELEAMGFKLCAYPLSLLGVSVRAMEEALAGLKRGRLPAAMPSFAELQAAVGFPEYYAEEQRYAAGAAEGLPAGSRRSSSGGGGGGSSGGGGGGSIGGGGGGSSGLGGNGGGAAGLEVPTEAAAAAAAAEPATPAEAEALEPDVVVEPGRSPSGSGSSSTGSSSRGGSSTIDLALLSSSQDDGEGQRRSYGQRTSPDRQAQWLRIKVSDVKSGTVKLDTRFPAGFLNSVSAFMPAVAGVDLEGLVKQAVGGDWDPSQPLLDEQLTPDGDHIQVYLEFA